MQDITKWCDNYITQAKTAMDKYLDAVEQQYGERPEVEYSFAPMMQVSARFKLHGTFHGYPHRFNVNKKNAAGYRKPHLLMKKIIGYAQYYFNNCNTCKAHGPKYSFHIRLNKFVPPAWHVGGPPDLSDGQMWQPATPLEKLLHPSLAKKLDHAIKAKVAEQEAAANQ